MLSIISFGYRRMHVECKITPTVLVLFSRLFHYEHHFFVPFLLLLPS